MIKPLYMLADSQLLFWKDGSHLFLGRIREQLDSLSPKAAYIGASNGDSPEFYSLFQAAMSGIDVPLCRMIPSSPSEEDRKFLASADLVLLAGGDVAEGWNVFEKNGMKEMIAQKRYDGSVLVGVSAGAVQLGLATLLESTTMTKRLLFQFTPFHVEAHDEQNECHVGDRVLIVECRPLSRDKRWRVSKILERAQAATEELKTADA